MQYKWRARITLEAVWYLIQLMCLRANKFILIGSKALAKLSISVKADLANGGHKHNLDHV